MTEPTLQTQAPVDDGVVPRLARDDVERKRFLKMAGRGMGAGAAATSLAAFIAACGGSSGSSSSAASAASSATTSAGASTADAASTSATGDLAIVNYALTLEYLESQFYAKVIKSGLFHGKNLSVIKTFGAEEADHVLALRKVASSLGTPAARPTGKFPIKSAAQVTTLAGAVENLGAAAYLGQAPHIKSKEILAAALAIHSVEARHAATINLVLNKTPTPDGAFAKPASMAQVLAAVKPFIA
ncbi:MAG: ferritin-like domain-containing protein [Solirubrobacteraceae bacterium]